MFVSTVFNVLPLVGHVIGVDVEGINFFVNSSINIASGEDAAVNPANSDSTFVSILVHGVFNTVTITPVRVLTNSGV